MTRDELYLVKECLHQYSLIKCTEPVFRAIDIVNRELKLKDLSEEVPFMHKGNNAQES